MNLEDLFKFNLFCYDCGLSIVRIKASYNYHKWIKKARKNDELLRYKKAKKCYICGNGPSLSKVNIDELDGDTIVMNDYWRVANKYKTLPTFYLLNDSAYILDEFRERMEGVLNCYPNVPHIFASDIGPTIDEKYSNFKTNIYYFNPYGRTFKSKCDIDFTKATYTVWNVVTRAIQLAIYLGYKEIYLIGCDYSLFASKYIQHAYDKNGDKVPCPFNMKEMLYKYSIATHIHYELAQYANEHGIKVVNMTKDSLLDAYDMDPSSPY